MAYNHRAAAAARGQLNNLRTDAAGACAVLARTRTHAQPTLYTLTDIKSGNIFRRFTFWYGFLIADYY